jgi:hypothetical protein
MRSIIKTMLPGFTTWICILIAMIGSLHAQTIVETGVIQGEWNKSGSPYIINGDIVVPENSSLTIKPGVEIRFTGYYSLLVNGTLYASGLKKEPIQFAFADSVILAMHENDKDSTSYQTLLGWKGIRFRDSNSHVDTSIINYCYITDVKSVTDRLEDVYGGALSIIGSNIIILSNTIIRHNEGHLGAGIYAAGSKIILDGCLLENNHSLSNGGAIYLINTSIRMVNTIIRDNISERLGGAIFACNIQAEFFNNVIARNHAWIGGAMVIQKSSAAIINNTIADNIADIEGGGLHLENTSPLIMNSILSGNRAAGKNEQLFLNFHSYPELAYDLVEGGKHGISLFTDSTTSLSRYDNILSGDPGFIDADSAFYSLREGSVCIDGGWNNIDNPSFPETDIAGINRLNNTNIDLGAWEFNPNKEETITKSENEILNQYDQYSIQIFPNPSKGKFWIEIKGNEIREGNIQITNIAGQVVHEIPFKSAENGNYFEMETELNRGVYFIELSNIANVICKREKVIIE